MMSKDFCLIPRHSETRFFIAGSFTYGALLVYPLYQALAGAKGQEEAELHRLRVIHVRWTAPKVASS